MGKEEVAAAVATVTGKAISMGMAILPAWLAASIAHWSATELAGRRMSRRSRVAIALGSLSVCFAANGICTAYGIGRNWSVVIMWFASFTSEHILRFLYAEFGGIVKQALKDWAKKILTPKQDTK